MGRLVLEDSMRLAQLFILHLPNFKAILEFTGHNSG